jgi:hypothetical protein
LLKTRWKKWTEKQDVRKERIEKRMWTLWCRGTRKYGR